MRPALTTLAAGLCAATVLLSTACAAGVPGSPQAAAGGSVGTSSATAVATTTATSAVRVTGSDRILHPRGFVIAKRQQVTLPGPVVDLHNAPVSMTVGDWITVPVGAFAPDNGSSSDGQSINGVLVLAEVGADSLTYQAIGAGLMHVDVGPVGHPGGCNQPGRSCADATPPPSIAITVRAG